MDKKKIKDEIISLLESTKFKNSEEYNSDNWKIKNNRNLLTDFNNLDVDDLYNKYHNKESLIYNEINNYILKFGSRVTDELKMETITMIEDNKVIYEYLKNIVSNNNSNRVEEKETFVIPRKLRFISKLARKFIKNRERLRLKRTYIYSVVRNIFLCFGRNFKNEGRIDNVSDVFYLTKQEVFSYDGDFRELIDKRKKEEFENKNIPYYDRYVFYKNGKVLEIKESIKQEGLKGIPSGGGVVTQRATIMNSNKDYLEKGNIIEVEACNAENLFLKESGSSARRNSYGGKNLNDKTFYF